MRSGRARQHAVLVCLIAALAMSACQPTTSAVPAASGAPGASATPSPVWSLFRSGAPSRTKHPLAAANCTYAAERPTGDPRHLAEGERYEYADYPPSGGPHDAQPLSAGWYDKPLTDDPAGAGTASWVKAVHSLEHGYVVVLWHDLPTADRTRLKTRLLTRHKVVVAPDQRVGAALTMLAWGVRQTCTSLDVGALENFIRTYVESSSAPEPTAP